MDGLVERARQGDAVAFSELYATFADRVFRFCLARVGRVADAEDLTQVTFLRVIEGLPRYESRGLPFGAWLFKLARNSVIDFVRARHDHADLQPLVDHDHIATADDRATPDPGGPAIADDLERVLPFLTPEQRDVITYRFFAGLTAREIGQLMGKRETAVRALQFRALGAMRRHLEAAHPSLISLRSRTAAP